MSYDECTWVRRILCKYSQLSVPSVKLKRHDKARFCADCKRLLDIRFFLPRSSGTHIIDDAKKGTWVWMQEDENDYCLECRFKHQNITAP